MDVDQMQYHYLFATGGKMIALALLGMAASILVCYLAARVGARVGRDIRGNVFRKVVGFSNNEFDHFSTASLITRSTNDIQQVQVLSVMILRMVSVCTDFGYRRSVSGISDECFNVLDHCICGWSDCMCGIGAVCSCNAKV